MAVYDPRGGGNVHIDVVLSNVSMGYQNEEFVASQMTPTVPVNKQSDKYYEFNREGWLEEPSDTLRAPGAPATEIPGLTVSVNPYFCQEHALKIMVTDEEVQNADTPLAPRREGTELVTERLQMRKELAVKDLLTTAANYASGHSTTLSGTAQWDDYTGTSTPKGATKAARDAVHAKIFKKINKGIFPYQVMSGMEDNPEFIERIKYSERGIITREIMAAVLDIPTIIVPGAGYNSANPGQADAFGYIWGKDVVLGYVPDRPAPKTAALMYEFNWRFSNGRTFLVDRWRDNDRVGEWVRSRERYDHRFIAVDGSGLSTAGYVIKAAVS